MAAAGRVAVMLIGLLRSFRSPAVVRHTYDYTARALELQGAAVDSFLCTGDAQGEQTSKISMIRSIWPLTGVWEDGGLDCSGEGKECPQFERLLLCFQHVTSMEQSSIDLRVRYDWFVRLRPDAVLQQPLPRITSSSTEEPRTVFGQGMYFLSAHLTSPASRLHVPADYKWRPARSKHSSDCKTLWDGFAVVPRSISAAYFSNSWRGMHADRVRPPQGWLLAGSDDAMRRGGCLGMVAPQRDPSFKKWTPEGVISRQVLEANGTLEPNYFPQVVGTWWSHMSPSSEAFAEHEAVRDACLQRTYPRAVDIIVHRNATPQGCSPLQWGKGEDHGGAGTSFDLQACSCRVGWTNISAATAADISAQYLRSWKINGTEPAIRPSQSGGTNMARDLPPALAALSAESPAATVAATGAAKRQQRNGPSMDSHASVAADRSATGGRVLKLSKAKCIQGKQLRTRKSTGKEVAQVTDSSVWVASRACFGGTRDIYVCGDDHIDALKTSAEACDHGEGTFNFHTLPNDFCMSFHLNKSLARTVVHHNSQDHHNGYYDEIIQYLLPVFSTLHEAQKQAPELWSTLGESAIWRALLPEIPKALAGSNGTEEKKGLSLREHLDGGALPAQLLMPARLVLEIDSAQQAGVNIDNGTGDFRGIEADMLGNAARARKSVAGERQCGRTLVLGSFTRFWPIWPGTQKEEHGSIKYYPWYLEAARAFRAGVLASRGHDPKPTVLERRRQRWGEKAPLKVLFVDRNIADNHADHSTRNVDNFPEAQAYVEKLHPGQFNFTVADWGVGSGLTPQVRATFEHDIFVGSEGAGFGNQVWLPLNAGVVQLHGKSYPKVFQWHTPVSQYYGHSVVNVKLPNSHRIEPEIFARVLMALVGRMEAVESRGAGAGFSQCITTNGECRWAEGTCENRAMNGLICQVEAGAEVSRPSA